MVKCVKFFLIALLFFTTVINAQSVGINTTGSLAHPSAMLDVSSTTKGFLAPRMTKSEREAIASPASGLTVFQTDDITGYYYYTGSAWTKINSGENSYQWEVNGNDIYYNSGNVGIGAAPSISKLLVEGGSIGIRSLSNLNNHDNFSIMSEAKGVGGFQNRGISLDVAGATYNIGANILIQGLSGGVVNYGVNTYVNGASNSTNYGYYADLENIGNNNNYAFYVSGLNSASNNYAFYSNGTAKSYFGGNVSIGTTNSTNSLEVSNTTLNRISASVSTNVQSGYQIKRTDTSYDTDWQIFSPASSDQMIVSESSQNLFTFNKAGKFGIKTLNPYGLLHLGETYGVLLSMGASYWDQQTVIEVGHDGYQNWTDIRVPVYENNYPSSKIRLTEEGDVGIGVNPKYRFHIVSENLEWPSYYFYGKEAAMVIGTEKDNDYNIAFQVRRGAEKDNMYTGDISFTVMTNGNVGIGSIYTYHLFALDGGAYSDGETWVSASDSRLKENITPYEKNGIKQIMKLKPVSYNYKSDTEKKEQLGFIAQEIREILPEVVSGMEGDIEKGETLGINYDGIVPVLTKAIQEQQLLIENQQKQIEELKKVVEDLIKSNNSSKE
ncbi:MAG: tail fiber domain-containing protein [Candidatus Delongbacteria bacterium]|nr:tail fiber domain-containing protein [Candidatus Delongbacteria bacterium]MBN2835986.1 tail fiber domain-containing protein [Candidatus Delongbacteria bacterium]